LLERLGEVAGVLFGFSLKAGVGLLPCFAMFVEFAGERLRLIIAPDLDPLSSLPIALGMRVRIDQAGIENASIRLIPGACPFP
jgi:hypothetical protein